MARVLVVEDDEDVLGSLEDALQQDGHAPVGVRSLQQALAADPQSFDVLLVDLWMPPGPSGLDLKRALDERQVTTPMILMSSDDEAGRYAVRAGCAEYLHKPFSPDQLHAALSRALAAPPRVSASLGVVTTLPTPAIPEAPDDGDTD
jgi:DNA-binding NtrC family response regulator